MLRLLLILCALFFMGQGQSTPADDDGMVNTTHWVSIGYALPPGEDVGIAADGTVNLWPDCAETQAERGFPDLDCDDLAEIGPAGTDLLGPTPEAFPLPDAPVGAFIGRLGEDGTPFLIGEDEALYTNPDDGERLLYVALNDASTYSSGDTGFFNVRVRIDYDGDLDFNVPAGVDAWVDTGFVVDPEGSAMGFTVTATGSADIIRSCMDDMTAHDADEAAEATPEVSTEDSTAEALLDISADGSDEMAGDDAPLPGAPIGALIARVGTSDPVQLGEISTLNADVAGTIQFRVNDGQCVTENSGGYAVTFMPVIADPARGGRSPRN